MAGYLWHITHGYETYMQLSPETKAKLPEDALRNILVGVIIPDLAKGEKKAKTHSYVEHPVYGSSYLIPDMKKVTELFLKKDPTYIGVLSHLKYDLDHIERFLLVYAKPCEDGMYENTTTGEKMDGLTMFGDWETVYGQLYQLYDKFNGEMVMEYTPKLNAVFGTDFSADKDGFLGLMKWLFPDKMPLSGIPEMDDYRCTDDIHAILKGFFDNDGRACTLNADIGDLMKIVQESAAEYARQIDEMYAD